MATVMQKIIFAVLVLQWASAAPSDVKLEDIAEVRQVEDKSDVAPATLLEENSDDEASQGQRRKRWPEMDDERQNWGIVMNGTEPVEEPVEDVGDGSRPISFDPITPIRPMNRPAPPVEHGSSQAGDANGGTTTTTTARPSAAAPGGFAGSPGLAPPSACDGAILSCCHQAQVTYDCFALQGCPDPSSYGNPCDPGVIFRVIERFQRFYGQRNG
ncbi:uncharacterized protein LOC135073967 isoform X2 [Ostrinia nubilalis]|uniref:uncharacterized protein LOC135073967 isoform X2 n=1 Tax=Ostrinia nubilalis TaxID=29057 RepID=UPI003082281A